MIAPLQNDLNHLRLEIKLLDQSISENSETDRRRDETLRIVEGVLVSLAVNSQRKEG